MASSKRRRLDIPAVSISCLAEELLMKIFQHLSFFEKVNLSRVCKRWKKISVDRELWKVIDIAPENAFNIKIQKIFRKLAGSHTKVLRLRHHSTFSKSNRKTVDITATTWNMMMQYCCDIEELYLEALDISSFKTSYSLPSTLRRLYVVHCYDKAFGKSQTVQGPLQKSLLSHKSLELIDIYHTPYLFDTDQGGSSKLLLPVDDSKLLSLGVGYLSRPTKTFLEQLAMMEQLTCLDMCRSGLTLTNLKELFRKLIRLERLDISDNTIELAGSDDPNNAWTRLWADILPSLVILKACRGRVGQAGKFYNWQQLEDPFRCRPGLRVVACELIPHSRDCKLVSALPSPTTQILV
ncbi:S-phase kinase-associated protein 2-like [Watersipora subatra]|uniref:S-phase kinase-associated protein 2-like n=1 Tax=Watersipora subatra TaxID=2589382 RepID=UPI00355AE0DC